MPNPADTNQASEDELTKIIDRVYLFGMNGGLGYGKFDNELSPNDAKAAIQALIRTEKLKLLAEVRERVVGENQHSEHKEWDCPCGATHSFTEEWHATNRLRDEQRTALAKLEAEL